MILLLQIRIKFETVKDPVDLIVMASSVTNFLQCMHASSVSRLSRVLTAYVLQSALPLLYRTLVSSASAALSLIYQSCALVQHIGGQQTMCIAAYDIRSEY